MIPSAQFVQHAPCVIGVTRFTEHLVIYHHHRVRGQKYFVITDTIGISFFFSDVLWNFLRRQIVRIILGNSTNNFYLKITTQTSQQFTSTGRIARKNNFLHFLQN